MKANKEIRETIRNRRYPVQKENIPAELTRYQQWVNWIWGMRKGKLTKIPVNPSNCKYASVNDPKTWSTFETAMETYLSNEHIAGIGFVFTESDPYCGIDIDKVVDPVTGVIKPSALQVVQIFNTYTEFSQSKTGIHLIAKGELPKHRGRKKEPYELYDSRRFFIITGYFLPGPSRSIEHRQNEIDGLLHELFQIPNQEAEPKKINFIRRYKDE